MNSTVSHEYINIIFRTSYFVNNSLNNSIQSVRSFTELATINRSSSTDKISEYYDLSDSIDNYKSLLCVVCTASVTMNMIEIPVFIIKQREFTVFQPQSNSDGWWFLSQLNLIEYTNKCKVTRWIMGGFTPSTVFVKIYGIK